MTRSMRWFEDVPELATCSGSLTTRIELSALLDANTLEVGLKMIVVGGKSWALRMVDTDCIKGQRVFPERSKTQERITVSVFASSIPTLRSDEPYPRNFPSGLYSIH